MGFTSDIINTCVTALTGQYFIAKTKAVNAVKYTVKTVKAITTNAYAKTFAGAASAGAALFIMSQRSNLLPKVVTNSVSSLMSSAGSLAGSWIDSAITTITYCVKLFGIDLIPNQVAILGSYILSFVNDIVTNASGILYTTAPSPVSAFPTLLSPSNPLAVFVGAVSAWEITKRASIPFQAAYDSFFATGGVASAPVAASFFNIAATPQSFSENISATIASIWENASIPNPIKILAAAKAWLVSSTNACYDIMLSTTSSANAQIIACCVGSVIAAMGAAWLTKKVYSASVGKISKNPPVNIGQCFQTYGLTSQLCLNLTNELFSIMANSRETNSKWESITYILARAKIDIMKQDRSCFNFAEKIIGEIQFFEDYVRRIYMSIQVDGKFDKPINEQIKSDVRSKFILLLRNLISRVIEEGTTLVEFGGENIDSINNIKQATTYELTQLKILLTNKQDNKRVAYSRQLVDLGLIQLGSASEKVENQIPITTL
jgi:hypothetical protein